MAPFGPVEDRSGIGDKRCEVLAAAVCGDISGPSAAMTGERVNVELSLRLGDRLGGHLVYGHVDATATVVAKVPEGQGHRVEIAMPPALVPYVVEKGYIAVDGVSLTVAAVRDGRFEIALIPETSARTTLGAKAAGDEVNLEIDPVARYALAGHRALAIVNRRAGS